LFERRSVETGDCSVDDVTRLLSDLVAIPSVNPMGRPLSGPGFHEKGMSDYLERWFAGLGVACERRTIAPGRDNVLAHHEAPGAGRAVGGAATKRPTLLFDVHQDTVPTDGMTIEPFRPTVTGGRLYGRGSCDVKGGMAAMLMAFARLVRERPAGSASVILACTVDEEFTHVGSSRLGAEAVALGASLAVVSEPTRLNLVNCHKGAVRWKIRAKGVACHSSTPEMGINAIYRMARVISAVAEIARELRQSPPHAVLGAPSLSVGRIEGGQSVNVVPDWCEIELDRRIIPGELPGEAFDRVNAEILRRLGDDSGEWIECFPPWINMPPLSPERATDGGWVDRIRDAITPVLGRVPEISGVPYGTDAGPLGAAGLPCVVFGPGDIAQAHTKDEWIELDQVRLAADAYYRMAVQLGDFAA
jgi:acetylornithine deacetylase/succinyl-diaminopimelate desuccinylase family protein